jgi:hypothetical protein
VLGGGGTAVIGLSPVKMASGYHESRRSSKERVPRDPPAHDRRIEG